MTHAARAYALACSSSPLHDNVTVMTWRDTPQDTEIIFVGGGQVIVRERPEDLTKRS